MAQPSKAEIRITAKDEASGVLAKLRGEFGKMQGAVGRVVGALGPIGASLAGFVSLGGAAAALNQFVSGLDDLADTAEGLGVTAVALAELRSKAAEAGVDAAQLDTAIGKLNNKIVDAAGGNERAAAAFKAMGVSIRDANGNIRGTEDVLRQVADRFSTYANTAEKGALAAELFGEKAGRKLVAFLSQGTEGLRQFTGLTDETVESAGKLQREIDQLSNSFQKFKNTALGAVVPAINDIIFAFRQLDLGKIRDEFNSFFLGNFGGALREYGRQLEDIQRKEVQRREALKDVASTYDEVDRLLKRSGQGRAPTVPDIAQPKKATKAYQELKQAVDDYAASLRRAMGEEANRRGVEEIEALASAEARRVVELDRLAELEGRLTSVMQERLDVIGQLYEAGRLSDDQLEKLTADVYGLGKAVEETKDIARDLGMTFSSAFEDAIVGGKDLRDVVRGLEQDILRIITRKLVTEPLANLFGGFASNAGGMFATLFGGGKASGGQVMGGSAYVVGEKGPELFVPRQSGQIIPNGARMGSSVTINIAGSATRETANQIAAAVSRQLRLADARAF